jgi:hypothetical protein
MLLEEALRLRQNWAMKGNPPCTHPMFDKEYYWGEYNGSYLCTTCGKSFRHDEWEQEIKRRENQRELIVDSCAIRQTRRFSQGIKAFLKQCAKLNTFLSRKVINRPNGTSQNFRMS